MSATGSGAELRWARDYGVSRRLPAPRRLSRKGVHTGAWPSQSRSPGSARLPLSAAARFAREATDLAQLSLTHGIRADERFIRIERQPGNEIGQVREGRGPRDGSARLLISRRRQSCKNPRRPVERRAEKTRGWAGSGPTP